MLNQIKEELIENNEDYIIAKNGEIIFKSKADLSFDFSNNLNIKVIHIIDKKVQINYRVEKGITINLVEVFYNVINSPSIEIMLMVEENSRCDYLSLRRGNNLGEMRASVNTYLKGNAYLNYKTLITYKSASNSFENIYLDEEFARSDIKNILINSSNKIQNYNINIYHHQKSTISNLLNYGICKNNSSLSIDSRGIISQGAHKAQIRQKTKGLLLDEFSSLSANPLLEIDDFDVIANHGASIGAIDEDELYYLMSRGLTKEESEKLIVGGFINPVIKEIKEGKFLDYIITWVNSNL